MQKIDFVSNLNTIVSKLESHEINNILSEGFASPAISYPYQKIIPLLFLSKSNYDLLCKDKRYSEMLDSLRADAIYSESNLSALTTLFIAGSAINIIASANSLALYIFHKSLLETLKLSKEILVSPILNNGFEKSLEDGIVVFQILIEGEGLETEKYIKIFSAFQDLIETISKIVNEEEIKSEIVLLDSGSDTNIGIKSGVETAASLYLIFKEIWDFITNFRYYKQKQNNKALLDSLSIRTEIQKKVEEGIITPDEGLEYTHIIKTRTDDLIGMKVLPKKIANESNMFENTKLLSEFDNIKFLTSGE